MATDRLRSDPEKRSGVCHLGLDGLQVSRPSGVKAALTGTPGPLENWVIMRE